MPNITWVIKLNKTHFTICAFRACRLVWLLSVGLIVASCIFPLCSDNRRLKLKSTWSAALVDALGVKVDADMKHAVPGALIVANHISWIDIFVINAVMPCAFVAKEDVRKWPLIGWLAAKNDTVFLKRGSRCHARETNEKISRILEQDKNVVIFPEGTTTDGRHVLHFHAALLQPALESGRPIVPTAISYWEPDGRRSLAPRYDGDISFGECIINILCRKCLVARLVTTQPHGLDGEDRRSVASQARAAIASAAQIEMADHIPN